MKIVIFSDNVAPYRIAWAEELGVNHEVVFAYVKDKDKERNDSWLVKDSKYVCLVKLPSLVIRNHAVTSNVVRYITKNKFDIVIFDGYGTIPNILGILYMRIRKRKYFINVDGVNLDAPDNFLKKWVKKLLFSRYAYFLCGSTFVQNWLLKYNVPFKHSISHNFSSIKEKDLLSYVPTIEERINMKRELGLDLKPIVLAVGRFLELKQFDMLIRAFAPYDKEYQLLLIGEGNEKEIYEDIISDMRLSSVKILPFMSFSELQKYYLAADLFVLPSNSEVWGLVVNEAMACGALPIIASDRCVCSYSLIRNGVNGYIFHYNDVNALSEKINQSLSDMCIWSKMCERSFEMIKQYTIEGMAKKHIEWFSHLVEGYNNEKGKEKGLNKNII